MNIDVYEVVKKLIGGVEPLGETNADDRRYENLEELINLIDSLIRDLHSVSHNKSRGEYSMHRAGKRADEYLLEIRVGIDPPKDTDKEEDS